MNPSDLHRYSVQEMPHLNGAGGGALAFMLGVATIADAVTPWGIAPLTRDMELRRFYTSEPWLFSAVHALTARNAGFGWKVTGPNRTAAAATAILQNANFVGGWQDFVLRFALDLLTQDNGAFIEIIRRGPNATDPVIGIANIDSAACIRTGDPEYPVIYTDIRGGRHNLRPWQVIAVSDSPSSDQTMNGIGYCSVSRALRASQLLRNIEVFKDEKTSGRFSRGMVLVSGMSTQRIIDAMKEVQSEADQKGLARFLPLPVLGNPNGDIELKAQLVDFASLPDGYDEETTHKWYVALLALALRCDVQDLAPLPGGGLGSSMQSQVLAEKSRGKGSALFQSLLAHAINWGGIIPQSCEFMWDEDDPTEDFQKAQGYKMRADARKADIESGVFTPGAARMKALEDGDMTQEQFDAAEAESADIATQDAAQQQQQMAAMQAAQPDQTTVDENSPNNAADSPGVTGTTTNTSQQQKAAAVPPTVSAADERKARQFWRRLMPEYADILDAKTAE